MLEEDLISDRPSVISFNDVTSQSTFGGFSNVEVETELEKLRNKVRCLENDNLGLRRSIPRLHNLEGKELTEEFTKLCAKLAEAEEGNEVWETECACKEQMLNRQRQEFFRQIELKENEIYEISKRAKELENENLKLRNEVENDQSKIFRLINKSNASDDQTLLDEFHDENLILKLRQDLSEKITENDALESKIADILEKIILKEKQFEDLQTVVRQQARTINAILRNDENVQELQEKPQEDNDLNLEKDSKLTEAEYIVTNSVKILDLLTKNDCESQNIRQEAIKLLQRYGHTVEDNSVTKNENFRDTFIKRRDVIKKRNVLLEKEIVNEFDNSLIKRHLDELNADSISSSLGNFVQPVANLEQSVLGNSFADIMRNTTGVDFLCRTTEVSQDLSVAMTRINALKTVCSTLFEKLRGTAEFLEKILGLLGETNEGRELLEKIKLLKLDLDKSLHEASFMASGLQKAEKSLADLRDLMSQTLDSLNDGNSLGEFQLEDFISQNPAQNIIDISSQFLHNTSLKPLSQNNDEFDIVNKELQQLYGVKEAYESLQITLKNELELKDTLMKQICCLENDLSRKEIDIAELSVRINDLEDAADALHQVAEQKDEDLCAKVKELEEVNFKKNEIVQILYKTEQELLKARDDLQEYNDMVAKFEEKEKIIENYKIKVEQLEQDNADNISSIENLRQVHFDLKERHRLLNENYRETDAIIGQTNAILYDKISDGVENLPVEESIRDDLDDEKESLFNIDEFSNFLNDCQHRANKIVQLLKRSEEKIQQANQKLNEKNEASSNLDLKIPYLVNLFEESRSIRLMLHKIARFFDVQKENMTRRSEKIIGREIRAELKKIYETLESARDSTVKVNRKPSGNVK